MGIPLRSASTMSLPEGASCESVLLGHPSGPGLSPQIGLGPPTGPPPSDWVSPFSWAALLRLDRVVVLELHPQSRPHLSSG